MASLLSWLWVIALLGFGVSGISLQRRFSSLTALLRMRRPELWQALQQGRGTDSPAPVWRWLFTGRWQTLDEPLIRAYAGTCLRLLRLTVAWLVGLGATLIML